MPRTGQFIAEIMIMRGLPGIALAFGVSAAVSAFASPALAGEDINNVFLDAKPILDVRYRFEFVDQDGIANEAEAHTVRSRFGLETGRLYGFGLGFDAEWIEAIGDERFNNTINGKTTYPVVADPDDFQVNQLFLISKDTVPDTTFKLGRQRIIWDNARFIGNVGFRQNEQTFDAFRAVTKAIPDTELEYVYLDEVHRIFGTESASGEFGLNSHGVRLKYSGLEYLTITPFALLLDYDSSALAGSDTQTYGVLLKGAAPLNDDWKVLYEAQGAYQGDFADNPADFDLWYYRVEPGIAWRKVALKVGYEVLEGDGTKAFQTPLATLHKFNGFTDKFLTTPADGIEDAYVRLSAGLPGEGLLAGFKVAGGYHQYWAENGGSDYGSEWDAGVFKTFKTPAGAVNLGVQYSSYSADNFATDTDKLWLTAQFKLAPKPVRAYLGKGKKDK